MKVLHIDTGRTFRGGQRQVYLLIRELQKYEIEQHLASPADSPLRQRTAEYINKFHALPVGNLKRFILAGKTKAYLKENKIDIIHAHDSHAHSLVWAIGIDRLPVKLIVTRRSSGSVGFGSRGKYRKKGIKYIAISNHIKQMLTEGGVKESAVEIISSMIDGDLLNLNVDSQRDKSKPDKIILSAGAFDKKKGYDDALRAVGQLCEKRDDFKYYLYGDGPQKDYYSDYIKKAALSDRIFLAGWYDEPADRIQGDIFLSPSHQEGLNTSIIESMAMGIPVVASDIPPHRENIINGENGLLFRVGNIEEMAQKINLLLDDSQLAQELAANARRTAEKFDSRIISEHVYNLYRQVVA